MGLVKLAAAVTIHAGSHRHSIEKMRFGACAVRGRHCVAVLAVVARAQLAHRASVSSSLTRCLRRTT